MINNIMFAAAAGELKKASKLISKAYNKTADVAVREALLVLQILIQSNCSVEINRIVDNYYKVDNYSL